MLITGIGFLVFAALIELAKWSVVAAAFVVGVIMVGLALVMGERLNLTR